MNPKFSFSVEVEVEEEVEDFTGFSFEGPGVVCAASSEKVVTVLVASGRTHEDTLAHSPSPSLLTFAGDGAPCLSTWASVGPSYLILFGVRWRWGSSDPIRPNL